MTDDFQNNDSASNIHQLKPADLHLVIEEKLNQFCTKFVRTLRKEGFDDEYPAKAATNAKNNIWDLKRVVGPVNQVISIKRTPADSYYIHAKNAFDVVSDLMAEAKKSDQIKIVEHDNWADKAFWRINIKTENLLNSN